MKKEFSFLVCFLLMVGIVSANKTAFADEKKENKLEVVDVIASTSDVNLPQNAIDNMSNTRWSGEGDGAWIKFDLGSEKNVACLGMSFYKADQRYTLFDIEVSNDDINWTNVYSGKNSLKTIEMDKFDIKDTKARYVRIVGHGYVFYEKDKKGTWNSINEVAIYSSDDVKFDMQTTEAVKEVPKEVTYTKPGLVNPNGTIHKIHIPNEVTGQTFDVSKYGILGNEEQGDVTSEVQKIINSAKFGDEVYFPNGTYVFKSALLLKNGVNLRGESRQNTTFLAERNDSGKYISSIINIFSSNNIVVSDLTVTSTFSGNYSINHKVNNPEADGPKYMIDIEGTSIPSYNIDINNVLVEKYKTMGIRIAQSHDVVIDGCVIKNATDLGGGGAGYGVSIQGAGHEKDRLGYENDSRFNVVQNCKLQGPYLRHGVLIQYLSHNNLVRNNTFIRTKLDAIDLHGEDEYLNEVCGNVIKNVETGSAIGLGNTGATHDKTGAGNYIHKNTMINCREGVKVGLGTEDSIIENNTIKGFEVDNSKGIYVQNAPGTIVEGNTIEDNMCDNFWAIVLDKDKGTDGRGIGSPTDITIKENTIENCSNDIKVAEGSNIILE